MSEMKPSAGAMRIAERIWLERNYNGVPKYSILPTMIDEGVRPLLEALEALGALDDGDQPLAWKHEREFDDARAALKAWKGE